MSSGPTAVVINWSPTPQGSLTGFPLEKRPDGWRLKLDAGDYLFTDLVCAAEA